MYRRSTSVQMTEEDEQKKRKSRSNSLYETENGSRKSNVFDELLQCGICCDRLFDSRMLPCQHTFCLGCLQKYMETNIRKEMKQQKRSSLDISKISMPLDCPTCSKLVAKNFIYQALTDLPKNIYIDNLLKLMEPDPSSPTSTSSPSLSCSKCQTICPLPGKCCEHCLQTFCSVCFTEHIATLSSNLNSLRQKLDECESKLKTRLDVFNSKCESIIADVGKATEDQIKNLKGKQKKCLQKLEELKTSEKNNVEGLKKRIEKVTLEMEQVKFEEIINDDEKVNVFMNCHKATSKLLDDVSRSCVGQIILNENSLQITQSNEIDADKINHITFNSIVGENPFESIENMSSYYRENVFKVQLEWNKCPQPAGIGISPWTPSHLYIAATITKAVLIMDRTTSKVIDKLSCSEMQSPRSIAFGEHRREVYVTDNIKHCIHVFSQNGEYLRNLSDLNSGTEKLMCPEGIAVMQDSNIVVCDTGNDRVLILNPENGKLISLLDGTPQVTPFQVPAGVTVFKDRVIVCDTGNNSIKVYSSIGEQLFSFGTTGHRKSQFHTPKVVVCDPMGFIFVGDSGNARIQIFTPKGDFLRDLSYQGKDSEKILWISGLAVTSQLEIIITDHKQRRLQISNRYRHE
ncbi:hypothetical protein FQR65_LT03107 [Abscondita terminalis]|nr:hypothetical protein FQR65_LT03107 [Abscondita terminalis]